jgi:hypothetical protein
MDEVLKPQQPAEGELVENPYTCFCNAMKDYYVGREPLIKDLQHHAFSQGAQAQLAHNKARMKPLLETVFSLLMGIKSKVDTESYYKDTTLAKTLKEIAKLLGYKEQS